MHRIKIRLYHHSKAHQSAVIFSSADKTGCVGGLGPRSRDAHVFELKMASHSQGIQHLLAAEKKAADLVSAARKRKSYFENTCKYSEAKS